MECGVHIGTKIDKKATDNIVEFIDKVFESGSKHNMESETIISALNILKETITPKNIELSHFNINGLDECLTIVDQKGEK